MDKPNFPEKQTTATTTTWTTWEELLLACAVHRYGTQSWDSVAAQLRKRSSNLHHLTPQICKHKFHDLRRRFNHHNDAVCDGDDAASSPIPWLDQLRQQRLDELRREVQRSDVSIVSLQSKVERLKEVREKSDLDKSGEEQEIKHKSVEPENTSPENVAEKEVSERNDGRSFDESNTTDPKPEVPETGVDAAEKDAEPVEPAAGEIGAVEKSSNPVVVEDSCNGSSDSVVKEAPVAESEKANSGELRESVAESKGTKESRSSSEVQSSASLSRKLGPELKPREPVEPDQEDQSPAMNQIPVESQPLVDFLGILRSHKAATFFERRLQSQDTSIYTNMIRQHTDFELVQTRLNGGWYSSCKIKFFRDILLICKNAIVFFGKRAPEYTAACELQLLVLKEMARKDRNQDPSPKQETHMPSKEETLTPPALPLKPETESSESLLAKSKLSIPLTACRKRSSIKARASTSSSAPDIKKEQKTTLLCDVKPAISWKQKEDSSDEVEEQLPVTKKRRKERVGSNSRNNSNKNSRSRSDTKKEKNPDANANANVGSSTRAMISNENSESIAEMDKKSSSNTSGKRQSAEKFLSRMKRSSGSNNKSEILKIPENDSKGAAEQRKNGNIKGNAQKTAEQRKNGNGKGSAQKEVAEQKKGGNGKGNAQKEQASRRGSGGRQAAKEQGSPTKRSVGRPSKRAAETTRAAPAKRRRY
ncbi:uncharacterized protein LOC133720490 [Rosa rugosa]|uniref:uncharacterized protein LOC133720490 n=1 Tax=Rosa rugosa TaxID=74645 RepID=UPI002B401B30|nr:uncharacterized protein LOC133720490 [Rosa rugosa]